MNLYERLQGLKDFRRKQRQEHRLPVVMIIVIMANMSGYFGVRPVKDFIDRNREALKKILKPNKGKLPSHQTIGRILQKTDFSKLSKIFYEWAKEYVKISKKEWISIDGKAIGGTVKEAHNQRQTYTNLVTVFSNKRKQALAMGEVGDKQSEIPLARGLIKMLDLEGAVFTMDALHCQKETTRVIKGSGNEYVIGVKGNQEKLYAQVKKTAKGKQ